MLKNIIWFLFSVVVACFLLYIANIREEKIMIQYDKCVAQYKIENMALPLQEWLQKCF